MVLVDNGVRSKIRRRSFWLHSICGLDFKDNYLRCESTRQYFLCSEDPNTTQANAGDSRSVLGVKGRAKPLSYDHKPQNEG